jgi:hypothetical protein
LSCSARAPRRHALVPHGDERTQRGDADLRRRRADCSLASSVGPASITRSRPTASASATCSAGLPVAKIGWTSAASAARAIAESRCIGPMAVPSTRSRIDGFGHTPSTAIASARISSLPAVPPAYAATRRAASAVPTRRFGVDRAANERLVRELAVERRGELRQSALDATIIVDRAGGLGRDVLVLVGEETRHARVLQPPQRDDRRDAHGAVLVRREIGDRVAGPMRESASAPA